jgi:hypothetical protein
MPRPPHLLDDSDFYSVALPFLVSQGFVITEGTVQRYDPTHLEGLTPSGKAAVVDIVSFDAATPVPDGSSRCTMTIAGITRSITRAAASWDYAFCRDLILDTWRSFPGNQR